MYIKRIDIQNFKAISELSLQFKPGVNILIGDNGVGKTSILDALVVALGGFLYGVNGASVKNIIMSDVKMDTVSVGSVSTSIKYNTPVKIGCELYADGEIYEWARIREDEAPKRNTKMIKQSGDISKYAKNLTNNVALELPVLSYQSSIRASKTRRGDFGAQMKKRMDDRRCGYLGCLDSVLDLKRVKEWCYEMQRIAFDLDQKVEEYEQFKHIVGLCMQKMSETKEVPKISYSRQYKDIVYTENGRILPISCLSAGYQSILWMIMDISYRMATLNPGKHDLKRGKGIVLIDEIDLHLHPKWQWNIIEALKSVFPNIQFIIATHSPIIISSCKDVNLVLVDHNQEVIYLDDAYGYSVNEVLELRQGSSDVLKSVKNMKNEFDYAINKDDLQKASRIVEEMAHEFGNDNTEVVKARTELEMEDFLGDED